jgi:diadenosine tetraphosphatase ApaH/serine/threonine PP2A family protein phosphatase
VGWAVWLPGPEDITFLAIADVELVANDRPHEGMSAEEQLAVDDGVDARIVGNLRRPAPVPAAAMTFFGVHGGVRSMIARARTMVMEDR